MTVHDGTVGNVLHSLEPIGNPQMYVYIKSEPQLWTVGFYDPKGEWQPESDHTSPEAAAKRVAYLNGNAE
jgi:hypothetical protein